MDDTRGLLSRKTRMSKNQFYRNLIAAAVAPTPLSERIRRAGSLLIISLGVLSISSQLVIAQQPQVTGQWETLSYQMTINPIRIALMHTGKVLIVAGSENDPRNLFKSSKIGEWDPIGGTIAVQQVGWDVFCNGGCFLPNGDCMIVGGTKAYDQPWIGDPRVALFDPLTNQPFNVQSMAHGRWYATVIALNDGRAMAFSGTDIGTTVNKTVEIYKFGVGWSPEYPAPFTPPLYAWLHLLPSGEVFYSGCVPPSRFFNPATHVWRYGPSTHFGLHRKYGNSVLLPLLPPYWNARVMILGGGSPNATATTETIDLPNGQWFSSGNMPSGARVEGLSVLLPNGKLLACGGSAIDENAATATRGADRRRCYCRTAG
jgi:hypothetical protein